MEWETEYSRFVARLQHPACSMDEALIRYRFKRAKGSNPNLRDPKTISEKIQWLKLNYRDPIQTRMSDKLAVRDYVADKVGGHILAELLGCYDRPDEIDFDLLPNQFVLKATHGWRLNLFCQDKRTFDKVKTRKQLAKWLRVKHQRRHAEWAYTNVRPRLLAEEYLADRSGQLPEIKISCLNGKPIWGAIALGRNDNPTVAYFDMNWQLLPIGNSIMKHADDLPPRPKRFDEMVDIAGKLSADVPFVRVDLYDVDGSIFFSELTLYPGAGLLDLDPPEWETMLGDRLVLPPPAKG